MFFTKPSVVRCPRCYAAQQPGNERCRSCGSSYSVSTTLPDRQITLPLDVARRRKLGGDSDETPLIRLMRFSQAYDAAIARMKARHERHWALRSAMVQATLRGDERTHHYEFTYQPKQTTLPKLDRVVVEMVKYAPELLGWPWVVDDLSG